MLKILIPGKPQSKQGGMQATVIARDGRRISMRYQPAAVRNYSAFVSLCAREAMQGRPPSAGPIRRVLALHVAKPKSWSKKRRARHEWALVRPDVLNISKTVDDALEGICYLDDKQIVEATESKFYDEHDAVVVTIETLDGEDHAWRLEV